MTSPGQGRALPVKAYRDIDFLTSPQARTLRILAEYLEPEDRFEREDVDKTIVFFGSARARGEEEVRRDLEAARKRQAADEQIAWLEKQLCEIRTIKVCGNEVISTRWKSTSGDGHVDAQGSPVSRPIGNVLLWVMTHP